MVREELVVPEVLVGNHCPRWRTLKKKYYNYNICNKNSANFKIEIQWGSEHQPFEYWKNLNTKLFEVRISNGWLFKWLDVICTKSTIWIPDQYIRKQDGLNLSVIQMVWLSSNKMAFEYRTIWHPTSFWPFEYQTSLVFRSPLNWTCSVFKWSLYYTQLILN